MPVKRSINLVLVDEKKINVRKAVPGILLIIVLAAVFSKFLVMDRLVAMSGASGRVNSVKSTLAKATDALKDYEGVEDAYAHMTYKDMTQEELDRVDRVKVLELVSDYLSDRGTARTWTVSGNLLTVEVSGKSLESLNQLARRIEQSPIVDTCVISTAQKAMKGKSSLGLSSGSSRSLTDALERRRQEVEGGLAGSVLSAVTSAVEAMNPETVSGRFTIYLHKPTEPEPTNAPAQTEADAGTAAEPTSTDDPEQGENGEPVQTEARKPARPSRAASGSEEVSGS